MPEYEEMDSQPIADDKVARKSLSIIRSADRPTAVQLQIQLQLPTERFWKKQAKLFFYAIAVLCGLIGNSIWQFERDLNKGAPWLWLAFAIWLLAEAYDSRAHIVAWWRGHDRLDKARWQARILPLGIALTGALLLVDSMSAQRDAALDIVELSLNRFAIALLLWAIVEIAAWQVRRRATSDPRLEGWTAPSETVEVITEPQPDESSSRAKWVKALRREVSPLRVVLFALAAISSVALWQDAEDNSVSGLMIALWFINAGLWAAAFAPAGWRPIAHARQRLDAFQRLQWSQHKGVLLALALIMILAASFRLTQLHDIPREMFVDHIEKLSDSYRVSQGEYKIFYSNNGGREPIHMHLIAHLAALPGFGYNFFTLKFLSVLISMVTLPFLYWLGVELLGEERRELGVAVGLMLTGLLAVSFAYVFITRDGLRYIMVPLFATVFMIYAARAARRNQRSDYVKVGLTLGFGMYVYQAMRMMPIAFVAIIVVTLLVRQVSWRERARYVWNLVVSGIVAFMIFLPLFRFMLIWPQDFWRRTTVSMAGYGVANDELMSVITGNFAALMQNIRDAMLMYNWRGDSWQWRLIPDSPEMDILCGTFLILGLAAWLVRMLRSREPVMWAMPLVILILLLPSALGVANPGLENPNYARSSAALPLVYLVAALPFGVIALRLMQTMPKPVAMALTALLFSGAILFANHRNTQIYFDGYYRFDSSSSRRTPYSEAGKYLRGFADSDGAFGNAFLIYWPHGWDFRIVAMEAGEMNWKNTMSLEGLPQRMARALRGDADYPLDPERSLLFFYAPHDDVTRQTLLEYFPSGYSQQVMAYNDIPFSIYRVPPLGHDGVAQFLTERGQPLG